MTDPVESVHTSQSNPPAPTRSGPSETVPPFEFDEGAAKKLSDSHPEKLFSLFAQALFSAPVSFRSNLAAPLPGNVEPDLSPLVAPKLKALVVGFTEAELIPLCFLLSNLKFDTVTAATADQTMEMLEVHPVTLLVVDCDLPATHASTLTRAVRRRPFEQPLIIGLTTQLTETHIRPAESSGLDLFCEKPLSHDLLIDWLREKGFAVAEPSL